MEALDRGLSGKLDQIYDHVLESILALDPIAKRVAQHVISWLLFAKRTLQPEALLSVLRSDPDIQPSETESVNLVDICHNLVMLDNDTKALSFCHPSARDFMHQQDMFSAAAAHQLLATACLRQCTAGPGSSPFVQEPVPVQDLYHYAAVYWPEHVRHSPQLDPVTAEAISFLFTENTTEVSAAFIVWQEWIRETIAALPLYHPMKRTFEVTLNPSYSPIHTACVFGLPSVLSHFLTGHPPPLASLAEPNSDEDGHTPLYLAAAGGHTEVVDLLLSSSPDILPASFLNTCGSFGTPLNVAAFRGHVEVVQTLLRHLDLSSASPPSEAVKTGLASAYTHACHGGRERVARLLTEENRRLGLGLWETEAEYDRVVEEAVVAGFRDLVEWLMGPEVKGTAPSGAAENATRERGLLLAGIKKGQVAVVRALLRMGKKWAEALPSEAMALAALAGHAEMVSFLHDEVGGVDLEIEGPFGPPLRGASLMGYDRVVRLLLSWGANPRACGRLGDALQAAAQNGHTRVMRLLMDKGADCNQPGRPRGTCLQAAAYYGHQDAVVLLLDQGADMYQSGKSKDALHAALEGGHEKIALLFLAKGYCVPPTDYARWQAKYSMDIPIKQVRLRRPWEKEREYRARSQNAGTVPARGLTDSAQSESDDGDTVSRDSDFDFFDDGVNELELSAAIGDIPNVRQRLLRPEYIRDYVATAFRAANVTGQVEVLRILLPETLALSSHRRDQVYVLNKALLVAARSNQPRCFQFLCERLADEGAGDPSRFATAVRAAASFADPEPTLTLLASHVTRLSPTLLDGLASAIRTAASAKHSAVVDVLWNWLFDKTIPSRGGPSSTPEETTAEAPLQDRCGSAAGELDDHGPGGPMSASLSGLLTAALETENTDAVESLLVIMARQGLEVQSIMPAFASACRHGSSVTEPLLRRRSGRLALARQSLLRGAYTAAICGQDSVLCTLLDELLERGISLSDTEPVDAAMIGAARHGHADTVRSLLNTPRFCSSMVKMKTAVTHAAIAATMAGHIEVVRLCLHAGADVHSLVSQEHDLVHLDKDGRLAVELNAEDLEVLELRFGKDVGLLPGYDKKGPAAHYERSLTGLPPGAVQSTHELLRRSHRRAGNGLHMALRGFLQLRDAAPATWHLPSTERTRQRALVSLMLENGCNPRQPDASGQLPIEMAAEWADEDAVQKLLDEGVFAQNSSGNKNDRSPRACLRLACQNQSATAFRVVLQFLRAGGTLPSTDDGQVTTEVLGTLERSFALVETQDKRRRILERTFRFGDTRRLMDNGMRALLEIIFTQLPHQKADGQAFGTLLVVAATAGDQASVELLLRHGALAVVDGRYGCFGATALESASKFGHADVISTLLDWGARIESERAEGWTLRLAVEGGHIEAVGLLVERTAAFQRWGPFGWPYTLDFQVDAVESNKLEMLRYLVAVDGEAELLALVTACKRGKPDFAACLLPAVSKTTPNPLETEGGPLYVSCLEGYVDIARQLIEHGANVNRGVPSGTPLMAAASRGHVNVVRLLLDNGADPNQQPQNHTTAFKIPPLTPVSFRGNPVRRQRQRQQRKQEPFTALSVACREGFQAIAELLLSRGAAIAATPDQVNGASPAPNAIVSTCEGDWSLAKPAILELLLETASTRGYLYAAVKHGLVQAALAHNQEAFDLIMEYLPPTFWSLIGASVCGSLPSIIHHLNQGINPNTPSRIGSFPLHAAAYNLHPAAVSHLLTHGGADVNQLNNYNTTPLLCALVGFHYLLKDEHASHEYQADMGIVQFEAIIRCLLDHGARVDLGEFHLGRAHLVRALDVAVLIGHKEVERLLQERRTADSEPDCSEQSVLT